MNLLVDSHALLWAADDPDKLSANARAALQDAGNQLFLSATSVWEIAIKVGLKKLALSLPYRQWMNQVITDLHLTLLPITIDYADIQAALPYHHGDPFDRLLVAQAQAEKLGIVSNDPQLDLYGIKRLW